MDSVHQPRFMQCNNAKSIVIFIHGFMGSPNQFYDLMEVVYRNGLSAASVLLPGHGRSKMDFVKATLQSWEQHLQKELERYQNYEHIYLVGHSIGGLLALSATIEGKQKIEKVVLLSTPLKVYLFNPISWFRKFCIHIGIGNNEVRAAYKNANSIGKVFPYCVLWFRVLLQPHKLMRKLKRKLGIIKIPILVIHSKKDETVSWKSAELFDKGLTGSVHEMVTLNHSHHAYYTKEERQCIAQKLLAFIID